MSEFCVFGWIREITPSLKGYVRLTITTHVSFRVKLIKFNVWDSSLLQKETLQPFKVGDEVKVTYSLKKSFPHLIAMIQCSVDTCPICYATLEATYAQRWECDSCRLIPREDHWTRVNAKMQLKSHSLKEYMYSKGYRLELFDRAQNKSYLTVVFKNSHMFDAVKDLRSNADYYFVGWVAPAGTLMDLVDVY